MVNSRAKGARFELEVAKILSSHGMESRRGQQFAGSPDTPDVISPDFPFHIEAKMVEKLNLQSAMDQSERDCGTRPPCVIHKRKRKDVLFTCKLDDLIKLFFGNE